MASNYGLLFIDRCISYNLKAFSFSFRRHYRNLDVIPFAKRHREFTNVRFAVGTPVPGESKDIMLKIYLDNRFRPLQNQVCMSIRKDLPNQCKSRFRCNRAFQEGIRLRNPKFEIPSFQ
ncbi:unnamed protein product [Oikopleura dioica]|uniref:Uncharacterized protein n=1 Tax=Oikopleura dioica TaxID=34765 RepID=E4YX98_OIKDI|nr:unnamed protein product [Oikopleura dioica]